MDCVGHSAASWFGTRKASLKDLTLQPQEVRMTENIDTKVTPSRKGWQVSRYDIGTSAWVKVCWFADRTQAYAYAYALEHGL